MPEIWCNGKVKDRSFCLDLEVMISQGQPRKDASNQGILNVHLNLINDDATIVRKDNNYVLNGVLLRDIEAFRSIVPPSPLILNADIFMLIVYKAFILNPFLRYLFNTFYLI
jgi:hypothetical protein